MPILLGPHEQHGQHLPLGTDGITTMPVVPAGSASHGRAACAAGVDGLTSPQHMYEPRCAPRHEVTVRASTYLALINNDLAPQPRASGVRAAHLRERPRRQQRDHRPGAARDPDRPAPSVVFVHAIIWVCIQQDLAAIDKGMQ